MPRGFSRQATDPGRCGSVRCGSTRCVWRPAIDLSPRGGATSRQAATRRQRPRARQPSPQRGTRTTPVGLPGAPGAPGARVSRALTSCARAPRRVAADQGACSGRGSAGPHGASAQVQYPQVSVCQPLVRAPLRRNPLPHRPVQPRVRGGLKRNAGARRQEVLERAGAADRGTAVNAGALLAGLALTNQV